MKFEEEFIANYLKRHSAFAREVASYYRASLVNRFLIENYCKPGERWGSKHEKLLEKAMKMQEGKRKQNMKEAMRRIVMHWLTPHLPKSFLEAKHEAENEERLFSKVVDLDERINEKMQQVFWNDDGLSVQEKFDIKKRKKEKKFISGPNLAVD